MYFPQVLIMDGPIRLVRSIILINISFLGYLGNVLFINTYLTAMRERSSAASVFRSNTEQILFHTLKKLYHLFHFLDAYALKHCLISLVASVLGDSEYFRALFAYSDIIGSLIVSDMKSFDKSLLLKLVERHSYRRGSDVEARRYLLLRRRLLAIFQVNKHKVLASVETCVSHCFFNKASVKSINSHYSVDRLLFDRIIHIFLTIPFFFAFPPIVFLLV